MPGKARRVQITERQQSVLLEFSRSRTESKSLSQRAQIVLSAFDGRLNVMRKLLHRGSFTSIEDLEGRLEAFFEYFNAVLAHPFSWTYTGRPLAKPERTEYRPPHRRALHITKAKAARRALS